MNNEIEVKNVLKLKRYEYFSPLRCIKNLKYTSYEFFIHSHLLIRWLFFIISFYYYFMKKGVWLGMTDSCEWLLLSVIRRAGLAQTEVFWKEDANLPFHTVNTNKFRKLNFFVVTDYIRTFKLCW